LVSTSLALALALALALQSYVDNAVPELATVEGLDGVLCGASILESYDGTAGLQLDTIHRARRSEGVRQVRPM